MKEAFRRVEAAHRGRSRDGRARQVFVAEAQRLAEVKGDDVLKAIDQGAAESQRPSKEKAELIYRLKQDVEHYANQARAQELLSKQRNLSTDDADAFTRRQKEFEKLRDEAQKKLTKANSGAARSPPLPAQRVDEVV